MLPNQGESLAEIAKKLFPCAETTGNGSNSNNDVRRIRKTTSPERIYTWRRDEKLRIGAVAFASAGGKALTPEEELRALRQEFETTKRERDILKKALAIFSKEPQTR